MKRALLVVACSAALLALADAVAGATGTSHEPFPVQSASLSQQGQLLIWRVDLEQTFTTNGLAQNGRSLCLLLFRGRALGALCVRPPSHKGAPPRLAFSRGAANPDGGRAIDGSITRTSWHELTASFLPASIGLGYRWLHWQVLSTLRPPACAKPTPCSIRFPLRPALARLHTPRLVGCVPSGPPFVYNGPANRRVVALTFDDGPWPDTPAFLSVLERKHVPATFFQIGDQISAYGGPVERRMLADGDVIGDHTWSHPDVAGDGPFAAGQISQTAAAIRRAAGFTPCLFRAPYGEVSRALIDEARSMGFTTIQWNVDPRDWSRPGADAIYSNVVDNASNGAIVLQHDGGGDRSETLAALPREIDTLRARGYQFATVTQLLGQRLLYK
jgi:peptidoglycan/xylan/chitin deacetylase (PgdA/CDA1 family)